MAGVKRQSLNCEQNKTNAQVRRSQSAGEKSIPEPTKLQNAFLILKHICPKIVLFEPKINMYLAALFCGSLVSDFLPIPRSYFSRKNNFFNYYFVKLGWGWTLFSVGAFLGLTSWVYCCGNLERVKKHFYRLAIGTVMWFSWTKVFVIIEAWTAVCSAPKHLTKIDCLLGGSNWKGFDISGHAFLLIYCSLLITEETKAIKGWERIEDLIKYEEFEGESLLKGISEKERSHLKENYNKLTPCIRCSFIFLKILSRLWDFMLFATIIYFHNMVEKMVGGIIAIIMWYFTYKWWYYQSFSPGLPGDGCFKYIVLQPTLKKTCH